MDADKLRVLHEIQYGVSRVCGLCRFGWFPNNDWGTCEQHTYEHEKHVPGRRQLSIHKFGSCPRFELAEPRAHLLGAFQRFLPVLT